MGGAVQKCDGAVLHRPLRDGHYHGAIRPVETGQQKLRLDGAYLFGGKVHHGDYLAAHQILRAIEIRYLGAALAYPELGTEIRPHLVGGPACLGEGLDPHQGAHSQLYHLELLPAYGLHLGSSFHTPCIGLSMPRNGAGCLR
ncbi:hypothetical protein VO70_11460 [Aeromonas salmonicida]|nr:hypothetical protein VO70_11460 [Aeromonas salmonicida]